MDIWVRGVLTDQKVGAWKLKGSWVADRDLAIEECRDFVVMEHPKHVPDDKRSQCQEGIKATSVREPPAVEAKQIQSEKVETAKVCERLCRPHTFSRWCQRRIKRR